jgi:hypothetical protein
VPSPRRFALDLAAAAAVPFLSVWLYEISNLIILAAEGCTVSITVAGLLPIGVAGVSVGVISPATKILQVAVSLGLILPAAAIFTRTRLFFARASVVLSASVYVASAYWELLSSLSVLSMAAHTEIFVAGTCMLSLAFLWGMARPKPPLKTPSL